MKFRIKPVIIEAYRWFQNGDHPKDECEKGSGCEGKLVGRYRRPECDGRDVCKRCGHIMHDHGWIDTLEYRDVVCPGDWILEGINGEFYPRSSDAFEAMYERV